MSVPDRPNTAQPPGLTPAQPDGGGQRGPEAASSCEPPPTPTTNEGRPETKRHGENPCLKWLMKAALREGLGQEGEGEGTVVGRFFGGWASRCVPPQPAEKAQMGQGL